MRKNAITTVLTVCIFSVFSNQIATAQTTGRGAQQDQNQQAVAALRERMAATQDRIKAAKSSNKITARKATSLRSQITQTKRSMARLSSQQGFVSAGELASYNRTLGIIDVELDNHGVARSYGSDMLPSTVKK